MVFKAICHCGNILLEVSTLKETITQCNCSICRRLASQWMYFKTDEVKVSWKKKESRSYMWGDKEILFHHCPLCGCTTHYTVASHSELDRIAINANMLEPKLIENLKIRRFNGAEM